MIKAALDAPEAVAVNQAGDAIAGIAQAATKIKSAYSCPLQNHTIVEPMNATEKRVATYRYNIFFTFY